MTDPIVVAPVAVRAVQTLQMLARPDAELAGGGYTAAQTFGYSPDQLDAAAVHLVGATVSGRLVGIGGVELQADAAELKRFFVEPAWRGAGVADALIGHLLRHAERQGVAVVRLETGDKQLAAQAFYRRHGFTVVPRFPPYEDSATSVCMSRAVASGAPAAGRVHLASGYGAEVDPTAARSFGTQAANYALNRPSYPPEAVEFVLAGLNPRRVVDLGAGTGKLTSLLNGRAGELIAIDPDPEMLAELSRLLPGVTARLGSAEQTNLPDGSVDAVFVGQAFHWFARPEADYELARVLRTGGVAGLLWNFPDTDADWVSALYDVTTGVSPARRPQTNLQQGLFDTAEQRWFSSVHQLDGPEALIGLVNTWSWVINRTGDERAATDEQVRLLIDRHQALQGARIEMPIRTRVVRQYRR